MGIRTREENIRRTPYIDMARVANLAMESGIREFDKLPGNHAHQFEFQLEALGRRSSMPFQVSSPCKENRTRGLGRHTVPG